MGGGAPDPGKGRIRAEPRPGSRSGWGCKLFDFGHFAVEFVTHVAGILVSEGAPGWVALALVAGFLLATASLMAATVRQTAALDLLRRSLRRAGAGRDTSGRLDLEAVMAELREASAQGREHAAVTTAWMEFRETLLVEDAAGEAVVRNSVRPAVFFNLEDLGFGPGWLRSLPNLFVAVGLLLTFLGLIAALDQFQNQIGPSATLAPGEMAGFLSIASAKFIMSLTGLACSILFTMALRWRVGEVERALRSANETIEESLSFQGHEEIAAGMLREQQQMRSILQGLATDVAAQISQSLSATIGGAIQGGLAPLLERIQAQSSEGIGAMVRELSERLSGDVGRALAESGSRLEQASERLTQLGDQLSRSGETLRSSLEAGATAAAAELGRSATQLAETAGRLQREIAEAGQQAASVVADLVEAADGFGKVAGTLTAVAQPLAEAAGRIERSNKAVEEAAGRLAQTAASSAGAAEAALEAVRTTLGAKTQAIEAILVRLREITEHLQGHGAEMDRIDQALGEAFDRYTAEVQTALDQLQGHVRRLQDALAPGLDTLREVVEQVEAFRPTSPDGRR